MYWLCNRLSEVHHVFGPLSSSDDENDGNPNELMNIQRRTDSSSDLSETAADESRLESKQSKTRSSQKSLDFNDERHERPNEKGMQTNRDYQMTPIFCHCFAVDS